MYRIIRMYSDGRKAKLMAEADTLKEAQAWCNDPETSSRTCSKPNQAGCEWFDGYEKI